MSENVCDKYQNFTVNPAVGKNRGLWIYRQVETVVRTDWAVIGFALKINLDDVLSVLTRNFKAVVKSVRHCWFNILLISASLNKNKEALVENNDVEPTMLSNLTPAQFESSVWFSSLPSKLL